MAKAQRQSRINGEITRTKILDSAEILFGAKSFDAVSLREITERADVTLALASYHFGTKEQLFEEVIARRAIILSDDRLARLNAIDNRTVETVIDAFMAPLFDRATSGEPGWMDYFKVLGRLGDGNQWLDVLARHFDDTAKVFIDALCAIMPDSDRASVVRAFTMMLNLMLATASQHGRIDRLTGGKLTATDLRAAYDPLLRFIVAGMRSVTA